MTREAPSSGKPLPRSFDRTRAEAPPVRSERAQKSRAPRQFDDERSPRPSRRDDTVPRETYRVEVGLVHGVKPGNIVGAIANEAGLEGQFIGRVEIHEDHSFVDLPEGMPAEIFRELRKVRVAGQQLQISKARKTLTRTFEPRARSAASPAEQRFKAAPPSRSTSRGKPAARSKGGPRKGKPPRR